MLNGFRWHALLFRSFVFFFTRLSVMILTYAASVFRINRMLSVDTVAIAYEPTERAHFVVNMIRPERKRERERARVRDRENDFYSYILMVKSLNLQIRKMERKCSITQNQLSKLLLSECAKRISRTYQHMDTR